MRATDVFLGMIDGAWKHEWESLHGALKGVTEEEAAWQHPSYAKEEQEEGWPPPGTILWQIAHVAHCKRYYAAVIEAKDRPPAIPRTPCASLAEELDALDEAHRAQRAAISALNSDDELHELVGKAPTLAEFLTSTIRHDTWHAGQIIVARRLFRER